MSSKQHVATTTTTTMNTTSNSTPPTSFRTHQEGLEHASAVCAKGRLYWTRDKNATKALHEFVHALLTLESLLGTYHTLTAKTYYWIGFIYKHYMHTHTQEALQAFTQTARIRLVLLGPSHESTQEALAAIRWVLQQHSSSSQEHIKTYISELYESIRLETLGDAQLRHKHYTQALEYYEEASSCSSSNDTTTTTTTRHAGTTTPTLWGKRAFCRAKLGHTQMAMRDYRTALRLFSYETVHGRTSHPDIPQTLQRIEALLQKEEEDILLPPPNSTKDESSSSSSSSSKATKIQTYLTTIVVRSVQAEHEALQALQQKQHDDDDDDDNTKVVAAAAALTLYQEAYDLESSMLPPTHPICQDLATNIDQLQTQQRLEETTNKENVVVHPTTTTTTAEDEPSLKAPPPHYHGNDNDTTSTSRGAVAGVVSDPPEDPPSNHNHSHENEDNNENNNTTTTSQSSGGGGGAASMSMETTELVQECQTVLQKLAAQSSNGNATGEERTAYYPPQDQKNALLLEATRQDLQASQAQLQDYQDTIQSLQAQLLLAQAVTASSSSSSEQHDRYNRLPLPKSLQFGEHSTSSSTPQGSPFGKYHGGSHNESIPGTPMSTLSEVRPSETQRQLAQQLQDLKLAESSQDKLKTQNARAITTIQALSQELTQLETKYKRLVTKYDKTKRIFRQLEAQHRQLKESTTGGVASGGGASSSTDVVAAPFRVPPPSRTILESVRYSEYQFQTEWADYIVRKPHGLDRTTFTSTNMGGHDDDEDSFFDPSSAQAYQDQATIQDASTLQIVALIHADQSRLYVTQDTSVVVHRRLDGSGVPLNLQEPLGWVTTKKNLDGTDDDYSLDEIVQEAWVLRQHYCQSVLLNSQPIQWEHALWHFIGSRRGSNGGWTQGWAYRYGSVARLGRKRTTKAITNGSQGSTTTSTSSSGGAAALLSCTTTMTDHLSPFSMLLWGSIWAALVAIWMGRWMMMNNDFRVME